MHVESAVSCSCCHAVPVVHEPPRDERKLSRTVRQPSTEAPPPEKVQELIKLLDDRDVRAWLATKSPSPSESAEAAEDAQISGWEHAMRNHLIAMRKAVPRIPVDAANAVRL